MRLAQAVLAPAANSRAAALRPPRTPIPRSRSVQGGEASNDRGQLGEMVTRVQEAISSACSATSAWLNLSRSRTLGSRTE